MSKGRQIVARKKTRENANKYLGKIFIQKSTNEYYKVNSFQIRKLNKKTYKAYFDLKQINSESKYCSGHFREVDIKTLKKDFITNKIATILYGGQ